METKKQELENVLSQIEVGGKKFSLVTITEPKFAGGKKCVYTGRVKKVTKYATAFNGDYVKNLANTAKRAGASDEEIEQATSEINASPYNHIAGALFELKSNPDKKYCRTLQRLEDMQGNETEWIFDGRTLTAENDAELIADIKANLYKSKPTNTRLDNIGVAAEMQAKPKFISIDNIIRVKQGNLLYE